MRGLKRFLEAARFLLTSRFLETARTRMPVFIAIAVLKSAVIIAGAAFKTAVVIFAAAFCFLSFFPSPISAEAEASGNTVDDLLIFLCELRYAKNAPYPPVEPEIVYSTVTIPSTPAGEEMQIPTWEYAEPRRFGSDGFAAAIAAAENRFGHLAEYWELVAQAGASTTDEFDVAALARAIDINPERTAARFYLLLSGSKRIYSLSPEFDKYRSAIINPYSLDAARSITEYEIEKVELENRNAFYPFILATCLAHEGKNQESLDMFKYAAALTKYEPPLLFPWDYLTDTLEQAASLNGVYAGIGATACDSLFGDYWNNYLFDFSGVKTAYSLLIESVMKSPDWKMQFTILHRAAMTFEDTNSNHMLNALISNALRGACRVSAMKRAHDEGDAELLIALIALFSQEHFQLGFLRGYNSSNAARGIESVPEYLNLFDEVVLADDSSGEMSDWIREWQARNDIDYSSADSLDVLLPQYREQMEMISRFNRLTGGNNAVMLIYNERESLKKFIKTYSRPPVSEFDYTNPSAWYRKWLLRRRLLSDDNPDG